MSDAVLLGQAVLTPSRRYKYIRTTPATTTHASSRALIECWRAFEAKDGMRMCRDIPSRALGKLLPHILIAEPIDGWNDARIRLAGTALIERYGRDIAGTLLRANYSDDQDGATLLLQLGAQAKQARQPGVLDTRIVVEGIEVLRLETVMLPIFAPDGASVWIMAGAFRL